VVGNDRSTVVPRRLARKPEVGLVKGLYHLPPLYNFRKVRPPEGVSRLPAAEGCDNASTQASIGGHA
jgi:hypothetical protein